MHVYEVLLEADNPNIKRLPDGKWQITYPDGRTASGTKDEVVRLAQEFEDLRARTRGDGRIEPRMSSDDPLQRRPNAPSVGVATRDVDSDAVRRAAGEIDPTGDERRSMRPSTPDADVPERTKRGFLRRVLRALSGAGAGTVGGKMGAIGALFSTVLTAIDVEEELDMMTRVFVDEVERQRAEGVPENELAWTQAMENQRLDTVDKIADMSIEGLVTLVIGAASGAGIWAVLGGVIGSGPVGWVAAIVGGGILGFYGARGVVKVLEWTGIKDQFKEYLDGILTPVYLMGDVDDQGNRSLGLTGTVDKIQGIIPGVTDDNPVGSGIGARPDRQAPDEFSGVESIQESTAPNEAAIMAKFKKAMKANPKLQQAFDNGKRFGQEVKQNLK